MALDVLSHLVEGGEMPRITRALRIVPVGRMDLQTVRLPTGREVDLSRADLIYELWTERARIELDQSRPRAEGLALRGFVKGILTSLVSGITVQVNDDEPTKALRVIEAIDPRTGRRHKLLRHRIETPGSDYLPMVAASVTAAARMLLRLAVGRTEAEGGEVLYVDTDGLDIDIDRDGMDRVRWGMEDLMDVQADTRDWIHSTDEEGYPVRVPTPRILRSEPENVDGPSGFRSSLHAAILAAKKHHLYRADWCGAHVEITDGGPLVVEPSDRELTTPVDLHIVRPSLHQLEVHASAETLIEGLEHLLRLEWGMVTSPPQAWSEPGYVLVPAADIDLLELHPGITPFSPVAAARIALVGTVSTPWHPGFDPGTAIWKDAQGNEFSPYAPGRPFIGEMVGQYQTRAWRAFDRRMVDADGAAIGPTTLGEVDYGPTIATRMEATGKESRGLGIGRGILFAPETAVYVGDDRWSHVRRAASRLAKETRMRRRMEELSGLSERGLRADLTGERMPEQSTIEAITKATAYVAAEEIRRIDPFGPMPSEDLDIIEGYLAEVPESARRCQGPECGKALAGRPRYWCGEACRKAFDRQPTLPL